VHLGPIFHPLEATLNGKGFKTHSFDLENTLTINSYIEAGCCPFLYGKNESGVQFLCDLLVKPKDEVIVEGYEALIISEIEDEVARFESISLCSGTNTIVVARNLELRKGEKFEFPIPEGFHTLIAQGSYELIRGVSETSVHTFQKLSRILKHENELNHGLVASGGLSS